MKAEKFDVSISSIILKTDYKKFCQKAQAVNTHFKDMCKEKNIYLIDNTNQIKGQHLNEVKLFEIRGVLMYLVTLLLVNYLGF